MRAVRAPALAQGADEIGVRPSADPGFGMGGYVGAEETAEGRFQFAPAGQKLAVVLDVGVAAGATRGRENVGAARDRVALRLDRKSVV